MSTFTPDTGTLFYAECTAVYDRIVGDMDTATVIQARNRSDDGKVFRCVASDDYAIVAVAVHGEMFDRSNRLMLRRDYTFRPVGPEVVEALQIGE